MKFIRQNASLVRSVRSLGALGLLLALAAVLGSQEVTAQQTRTIILNTGYDQWANALIPDNQPDNEWRVIFDPRMSSIAPPERPADVAPPNGGWTPFVPPASFPNSKWIVPTLPWGGTLPSPGPTVFRYVFYFTLPPGVSAAQLTMKLVADDHITEVKLNNNVLFSGSGGALPPSNTSPLLVTTATLAFFNVGAAVNSLVVTVEDTAQAGTGLIVEGEVKYEDCDRQSISSLPDLTSITFWESTVATPGPPTAHPIPVGSGSPLNARLAVLASPPPANDFEGAGGVELYDVFYSLWDGTPQVNGEFVTIEAVWPNGAPSGGGLNIAMVELNFSSGPNQFANSVASFVALGNNAIPADVGKAVDGNLLTDTTMGNTGNIQTPRLRITVGFPCTCVQRPSDMVAWWPMDELSGATNLIEIIFGGANNAALSTGALGVATAPQPAAGMVSGAVHFPKLGNGLTGARVANPLPGLQNIGAGDFTIDAWVKFPASPANTRHYIVNRFDAGTNTGYGFYIGTSSGGSQHLGFEWGAGPNTGGIVATNALIPNQWHHVAVTLARNVSPNTVLDIRLYVDGVQQGLLIVATGTIGSLVTFLFLEIGAQPSSVDQPITIDELEVFKRALTLQEIQAIFNARSYGKCKKTPGGGTSSCASPPQSMVAWYPLDEQAGAGVVYDIAGFDNNGTPQPGAIGSGGTIPVAGQVGGALYFASVANYIEVPPIGLNLANSDLTIDGWFAAAPPGSSSFGGIPGWTAGQTIYYAIVDKLAPNSSPPDGYGFFVRTRATPLPPQPQQGNPVTITVDLVVAIGNNFYTAQIYQATTTFPPPNAPYAPPTPAWPYGGQWLHVAVTVDRTNNNLGTFYLNGNPVGTNFTAAAGVNNIVPLWIGQTRLALKGVEFSLDEIEIFDRVLQSQEIKDIVKAKEKGKCKSDLGDAPDTTNHAGAQMTTYPNNIQANFPTVYEPSTPHGPIHHNATGDAWLGQAVSLEGEADQGWDQELNLLGFGNNIQPGGNANIANRDRYDDSITTLPPFNLAAEGCNTNVQFNYTVTVIGPAQPRYVNVWFDFTQDGDWDDEIQCPGSAQTAKEWAVQNQTFTMGPSGTTPYTLTTPTFVAYRPSTGVSQMWMRITLTDSPINGANHGGPFPLSADLGKGGSGPAAGYKSGETEDHLLRFPELVTGKAEKLCVFKFEDKNGNGRQDPDEGSLPGWSFTVTPAPLPPATSPVTTGPQGSICFGVSAPGTYTITEIVLPGWTPTTPNPQTVTVQPGQPVEVKFGNQKKDEPKYEICGIKFEDKNGNGRQDLGEPGLPRWTINLVFGTPPNQIDLQAITDASGRYCFKGLAPGTYIVSETLQSGWVQTFPQNPGTYTVTLPPSRTDINFGNQRREGKAEICVFKFEDLNGNGRKDANEPLLAGWTFNINPGPPNQVTTGPQGGVCFGVTAPRTYTITEVVQSGWTPTTANPQIVNVQPGQLVNVFFGNRKREEGRCDLAIRKEVKGGRLISGQQGAYIVTIFNAGNGNCNPVITVTDTLGSGLVFVSAGGPPGVVCGGAGQTVTCTRNSALGPGQSFQIQINVTVRIDPGKEARNCASVRNPNDANLNNNEVCITTVVQKQ